MNEICRPMDLEWDTLLECGDSLGFFVLNLQCMTSFLQGYSRIKVHQCNLGLINALTCLYTCDSRKICTLVTLNPTIAQGDDLMKYLKRNGWLSSNKWWECRVGWKQLAFEFLKMLWWLWIKEQWMITVSRRVTHTYV